MLSSGLSSNVLLLFPISDNFIPTLNLGRVYFKDFYDFLIFFFNLRKCVETREHERTERDTLNIRFVTKVIYRLVHKRKVCFPRRPH